MDRFVRGMPPGTPRAAAWAWPSPGISPSSSRGTFALTIDGDLFKATLTFPQRQKTQDPAGK